MEVLIRLRASTKASELLVVEASSGMKSFQFTTHRLFWGPSFVYLTHCLPCKHDYSEITYESDSYGEHGQ